MFIATLVYPNSFLADHRDEGGSLQQLIWALESDLADAAISLGWFEASESVDASLHSLDCNRAAWFAHGNRERELMDALARAEGIDLCDGEAMERLRVQDKVLQLQEMVSSGRLPKSYQDRIRFIHAKSFLFALDGVRKALLTAKRFPIAKRSAETALVSFSAALPELAEVRDSTAHADERTVGLARRELIVPGPVVNEAINAPNGGFMLVSGLIGKHYSCTLADGTFGLVKVSATSLEIARSVIQTFLNALPWKKTTSKTVTPTA